MAPAPRSTRNRCGPASQAARCMHPSPCRRPKPIDLVSSLPAGRGDANPGQRERLLSPSVCPSGFRGDACIPSPLRRLVPPAFGRLIPPPPTRCNSPPAVVNYPQLTRRGGGDRDGGGRRTLRVRALRVDSHSGAYPTHTQNPIAESAGCLITRYIFGGAPRLSVRGVSLVSAASPLHRDRMGSPDIFRSRLSATNPRKYSHAGDRYSTESHRRDQHRVGRHIHRRS